MLAKDGDIAKEMMYNTYNMGIISYTYGKYGAYVV